MRQEWQLWTSALTKEQCESLKRVCERFPATEGKIFENGEANSEVRRSIIRWVYDNSISEMMLNYAREANRNAFAFDIDRPFEVQYTEYNATNEGFYGWHHDIDMQQNVRPYDRKLSVVIQLDDPLSYEGGDFNFKHVQNPNFKPQGSVLVFPSYLEHMVTPVTSGVRHSLVTWVEGPRWK